MNYTVNNTEVQDIQSYVDSSGNVAYMNKRQKRRVNSFNTWLEAWHNYERLLLSFHGFHLYDAYTKYKLLMLFQDKPSTWFSLAILDMRHRLSLSGHSVQFDNIHSVSSKDIAHWPRPFLNHEFCCDNYLTICTDKIYGDQLCNQILYGLHIGFTCEQYYVISKNWPSSNKFYAEANEFLETGLSLGMIQGPHITLHLDFKSSPIGAFKRHRSNKVQPIHDLSWPPELSTNNGIDATH